VGDAHQPAALDLIQVLAQAVDFADRRAAGQQQPGQFLQVAQGNIVLRHGHQSRAATGNQTEDQIIRVAVAQQRYQRAGGLQAALTRHRVLAGHHRQPGGQRRVILAGGVLADQQTAIQPVSENSGHARRHRQNRFTHTDHQHAPGGIQIITCVTNHHAAAFPPHAAQHRGSRIGGLQRGIDHGADFIVPLRLHDRMGNVTKCVHDPDYALV